MAESRMLVPNYVTEDQGEGLRRNARACNIAKYLLDNFKLGKRINSHKLRSYIPNQYKDQTLDPTGDLKAHGDAVAALDLGRLGKNGSTLIDYSLPNLIRCARWVLGEGKKVGAVMVLKDQIAKDQTALDNKLIDEAINIPANRFTNWESDFVTSLDRKWRVKGLTTRQRARLNKILIERS